MGGSITSGDSNGYALTCGATSGGSLQSCYIYPYPHDPYPHETRQPQQTIYTYTSEPVYCIGKAHVFECEHVSACKCGQIKRVMPKKKA